MSVTEPYMTCPQKTLQHTATQCNTLQHTASQPQVLVLSRILGALAMAIADEPCISAKEPKISAKETYVSAINKGDLGICKRAL